MTCSNIEPYWSILVSTSNETGEVLSMRNPPTLKSLAPVPRSIDRGTTGCVEGGCRVLAGVGRSQACDASRIGSNSDAERSAGPLPLALRGRYIDSTCTKSFMSNEAARSDPSMCAWKRTLSTTPYTARLNICYKCKNPLLESK